MNQHERRIYDVRRGCLDGYLPSICGNRDDAGMKQKLLEAMERRMKALDDEMIRDWVGGHPQRLYQYREIKYWKEAIERGEFDVINDRKPAYADLDDE